MFLIKYEEGGADSTTSRGTTSSGPLSSFPCNMVSVFQTRPYGENGINCHFIRNTTHNCIFLGVLITQLNHNVGNSP